MILAHHDDIGQVLDQAVGFVRHAQYHLDDRELLSRQDVPQVTASVLDHHDQRDRDHHDSHNCDK